MAGAGTSEEHVGSVVARRLRSMSAMQGGQGTIEDVEKVLAKLAA